MEVYSPLRLKATLILKMSCSVTAF